VTQAWNNTFPPTEAFACIVCALNEPLKPSASNRCPGFAHCHTNNKGCARLHRQQRDEMNITPLEPMSFPPQGDARIPNANTTF
jgi:hypothetical protein